MKTKKLLFVGLVAVLFAVWGITSAVLAAEQEAANRAEAKPETQLFASLGPTGGATDVFHVICPAGTVRLQADVQDTGGFDGTRISVFVSDAGGNPAIGATAPDAGTSATVAAVGGAGSYTVSFFKSSLGTTESYNSIIYCRNSAGAFINPFAIVSVQAQ
jgi:hypothetical protein